MMAILRSNRVARPVVALLISSCLVAGSFGVAHADESQRSLGEISKTNFMSATLEDSRGGDRIDDEYANVMRFVDILDQLPDDLKYAEPSETPDYESKIASEVRRIEMSQGSSFSPVGGSVVYGSPGECFAAAVPFVVQFAVPVSKIVKAVRVAAKEWGSLRLAIDAIRRGDGLAELGEEGVSVLEEIAGIPSLMEACTF